MEIRGHALDSFSVNGSEIDVSKLVREALVKAVRRVKRARKWYFVDSLSKAFIKACLMMKLTRIRSMQLIKVLVKTIKMLRDLVSEAYIPIRAGIRQAWSLSALASNWGHPSAKTWRNNRAFILYHAMTLKLLSRLFGRAVLNES